MIVAFLTAAIASTPLPPTFTLDCSGSTVRQAAGGATVPLKRTFYVDLTRKRFLTDGSQQWRPLFAIARDKIVFWHVNQRRHPAVKSHAEYRFADRSYSGYRSMYARAYISDVDRGLCRLRKGLPARVAKRLKDA